MKCNKLKEYCLMTNIIKLYMQQRSINIYPRKLHSNQIKKIQRGQQISKLFTESNIHNSLISSARKLGASIRQCRHQNMALTPLELHNKSQ